MQQSPAKYQRQLFEEPRGVPAVRYPRDVQESLRQALAQWLPGSGEKDARGGQR